MITALAALILANSPWTRPITGQTGESLANYLSKHPWDVASRGPMLVVNPVIVRSTTTESGLRAFGRKEFNLGSLTVIAPTEMVIIDAAFKDPANLYDGLPRTAKIYYLMTMLDADQWKIACSSGIGLGNLRQDQRAVFRSILPSVFTYESGLVGKGNSVVPKPGEPPTITLTTDEETGVRLHFFQDIELGVKMQDGGFSAVSPQLGDRKREGAPYLRRSDVAAEDRTSLFGVQIRKVLENRLKPSDLNYKLKALDVVVNLSKTVTLDDFCRSIGASCGLKLIPDVRIGDFIATCYGPTARAGDVLQALALSVTGTFRKVADSYVLTSDLEGIGAKRLKVDTWKSDLTLQTGERTEEWKRLIGSAGGSRSIGFPTDSPLRINDSMAKFMSGDQENDGSKTMPANQLPPEWQAILIEGATHFGNGQVRKDVVFPYGETFWNFVLPDGRPLEWEESLGQTKDLTQREGSANDHMSKTVVKPIHIRNGTASALLVKTDDPAIASKLSGLAVSHGFEEIWLQTWKLQCLQEAVAAAKALHLRVRLAIRPWEIPAGSKTGDLDRTVLGDSSTQAENFFEGTASWQSASHSWGLTPIANGPLLAPDSPLLLQVWRGLIELSKTDGLDGVVLCDTEPHGYEPRSINLEFGMSYYLLDLGYTQSLRGRFLEDNKVDPVDIVDKRLLRNDFKLDLGLPFFGDPTYGGMDLPSGTLEKWTTLRAGANRQSVTKFVSQLSGEILFQPRHNLHESIALGGVQVVPWVDRKSLPTSNYQGNIEEEAESVPVNGFCVWQFGNPKDPAIRSRMYDSLVRHMKRAKGKLAIDLSSIPSDEIQTELDKWFAADGDGRK